MIVLGINGGFRIGYQDVAACLAVDGRIVAAVEEERISRIKFSPGRLPYRSVLEVLRIAGIRIEQVDAVAFHGSTWGPHIEPKVRAYFTEHFGYAPPLLQYHHHDCHAAATFYSSGFSRALVLTMDNSGDGISVQVSVGENGHIRPLHRFARPHSFGVFYSLITQYCGFTKDSDEYKLMGLAAYGNPHRFDFSWLLEVRDGEPHIHTDYVVTVAPTEPSLHRDEMNFNQKFLDTMGRGRRLPHAPLEPFYQDVAASAQRHLEQSVLQLLQYHVTQTGIRHVCTAGGVALNCLMNQKLMEAPFVDGFFVQPASTDAGIALGAAWLGGLQKGVTPVTEELLFLGTEYTDEELRTVLDTCQITYEYINDPARTAAESLARHRVIGWFQGRMEFGPRALGNRSILANPATPDVRATVNNKIKFRDSFRPFGASVLADECARYFTGNAALPNYMTINFGVKPEFAERLAGITHRDGSCRLHTVTEAQNGLYHGLLTHLKALTGMGVCLNTSFNLGHEPIVHTPQQALATFYGSGLDALFMGNYLIKKRP